MFITCGRKKMCERHNLLIIIIQNIKFCTIYLKKKNNNKSMSKNFISQYTFFRMALNWDLFFLVFVVAPPPALERPGILALLRASMTFHLRLGASPSSTITGSTPASRHAAVRKNKFLQQPLSKWVKSHQRGRINYFPCDSLLPFFVWKPVINKPKGKYPFI